MRLADAMDNVSVMAHIKERKVCGSWTMSEKKEKQRVCDKQVGEAIPHWSLKHLHCPNAKTVRLANDARTVSARRARPILCNTLDGLHPKARVSTCMS